jgi:MFS family permease
MTKEEKFVIFASSLGTIFEWYDFYLYAVLAPFFASLFFPAGNDTAALLSAFATYAAGFLVRPFGALIFGRIGDLVGRKYTFLVTIVVMGTSTFLVGLLPTYSAIVSARALRSAANTAARQHTWPNIRVRTNADTRQAGFRPPPRSDCCWHSLSSACVVSS